MKGPLVWLTVETSYLGRVGGMTQSISVAGILSRKGLGSAVLLVLVERKYERIAGLRQ